LPKLISGDDEEKSKESVQEMTNKYEDPVDSRVTAKAKEVEEV